MNLNNLNLNKQELTELFIQCYCAKYKTTNPTVIDRIIVELYPVVSENLKAVTNEFEFEKIKTRAYVNVWFGDVLKIIREEFTKKNR